MNKKVSRMNVITGMFTCIGSYISYINCFELSNKINQLDSQQYELLSRIKNGESLNKTNQNLVDQSLNTHRMFYKDLQQNYAELQYKYADLETKINSLYSCVTECQHKEDKILSKFDAMSDLMKMSVRVGGPEDSHNGPILGKLVISDDAFVNHDFNIGPGFVKDLTNSEIGRHILS